MTRAGLASGTGTRFFSSAASVESSAPALGLCLVFAGHTLERFSGLAQKRRGTRPSIGESVCVAAIHGCPAPLLIAPIEDSAAGDADAVDDLRPQPVADLLAVDDLEQVTNSARRPASVN